MENREPAGRTGRKPAQTDATIESPPLLVDFSPVLAQIREQLRGEVLAELRAELTDHAWPRWMNIATAARYIDVSPERVRKLVARYEIPFIQEAPGCRIFFDRHAIDTWLTTFAHEPRSRT